MWAVRDVERSTSTDLGRLLGRTSAEDDDDELIHHRDHLVVIGNQLVSLDAARVVGSFDGWALAVATDGRVLRAGRRPGFRELPVGPLRWVTPTPP